MADGLCIGSPGLVGGRKAGNSNMQDNFLHYTVKVPNFTPLEYIVE